MQAETSRRRDIAMFHATLGIGYALLAIAQSTSEVVR